MATSRTGTAVWKQVRAQAIRRARREGIDHCPDCGIHLDYEQSGQRNSAEADHIVPHSKGGKDHISNVRICCRRCNRSAGATLGNKSRGTSITTENNAQFRGAIKPITGRSW